MDDVLLKEYRTYVYRIRRFLLLGGVRHSRDVKSSFSYGSAILAGFVSFFMMCAVLNFCWEHATNLAILTSGMSFACSLVATSLRASWFAKRHEALIELEETMENLFERELLESYRIKSSMLSLLHTFDRPAYLYSFFIGATILMYFLPPVKLMIYHLRHWDEVVYYPIPFPARFPWIVHQNGFVYQLHFFYEVMVAWFLYFTNSGVDALFGFYIFQISSILRTLTYKLSNTLPDEDQLLLLRNSVQTHGMLLRCRNILEDVYGPIIVWMVLTNAVVMCALIFQAVQSTDMSASKLGLLLFYMFLKLSQTFSYAWYGGIITSESEAFREGLYLTSWLGEKSRKLKTSLLIAMHQRPLNVKASRIINVSVDMFLKIMNTTMSYFFLLQTIDENH